MTGIGEAGGAVTGADEIGGAATRRDARKESSSESDPRAPEKQARRGAVRGGLGWTWLR